MLKTYMNPSSDAVSTVQLSPFNESHWNRLTAKRLLSSEWMNSTMATPHQKTSLDRWRILGPIDINNLKAEDAQLLQELQNIRKLATIVPPFASAKEKKQRRQSKYSEEDLEPRPTSPSEEYDRSSDLFFQTRETSLSQRQLPDKQFTFHSQIVPPPTTNSGYKDTLPSVRAQLRQSAQTRENVLANANDRRSISPLSMASSKRAVGAIANLNRHPRLNFRSVRGYTPAPTEASLVNGFKEQIASDIASCTSSTSKKMSARSKNPSRTSLHLLKTKTDRNKQKQQIDLKTVLVKPCRPPIASDCSLDDAIPNSIEIMRRFGGPASAFEQNLRRNYQRQLSQFRAGSIRC